MVFQNYTLFPHMSVAENIAFPLRMRNLARSEIEARVARMLDMVRLPGFGERMPAQLSGGQQQRVALARAASYDPPLLLMDEPLGALDKNLREEMQYEIKQFHHAIGATILYVTHDQDEAASMSDRIAIVNQARIAQIGSARELYERPRNAFVASFLGEANLFAVERATRLGAAMMRVETKGGFAFTAEAAEPVAERAVACVRPEAIRIGDSRGDEANTLEGRVVDVVYTAGTIHYRVEVAAGQVVGVRLPAVRQGQGFAIGAAVRLGWSAADMVLIPQD
jgi:putative spermidine/putrescine transport system ATP-binding protein